MICELDKSEFYKGKKLFSSLVDHQLMLLSVIEGNQDGRIFVNDKENPSSGFVYLGKVFFLFAGNPDNTSFNNKLKEILAHDIFPNYIGGYEHIFMFYDQEWVEGVKSIFDGKVSTGEGVYLTLSRSERKEWNSTLSQDFTIKLVDKEFLENKSYEIPDEISIHRWLSDNKNSLDEFYKRRFAFAVVYQEKFIVSFCYCSYLSNDMSRCDLGIVTKSDFQRKGLGKNLLFQILEHCWEIGVKKVEWHSSADNIASIKLAESVGFKYDRNYPIYYGSWELSTPNQ